MFRRRIELHPLQRLRELVWPRLGWKRAFQYGWRRVWRLSGTPHAIAIGVAAGAFASFTPFLGFHFVIGFALAWIFRGNLIASAFGTFIGNPLTFPFIWIGTYDVGYWLLQGSEAPSEPELSINMFSGQAIDAILPVLVPMMVGGIPLGLVCAGIVYYLIRSTVETYQAKRREQIAKKAIEAGIDENGPSATAKS
ncbi:MAG: hypothetical protein COA62_02650 [Rhodobiaceae bacterium]|nr:MAG: hypothetical protein COA62_02650 [Rhodobiaceae bacterium]